VNYRLISFMKIDAKILLKCWQIELKNISEKSYNLMLLVSSQGCSDGSI
jgi:hypothetical protein